MGVKINAAFFYKTYQNFKFIDPLNWQLDF